MKRSNRAPGAKRSNSQASGQRPSRLRKKAEISTPASHLEDELVAILSAPLTRADAIQVVEEKIEQEPDDEERYEFHRIYDMRRLREAVRLLRKEDPAQRWESGPVTDRYRKEIEHDLNYFARLCGLTPAQFVDAMTVIRLWGAPTPAGPRASVANIPGEFVDVGVTLVKRQRGSGKCKVARKGGAR